jgi:ADYC domain
MRSRVICVALCAFSCSTEVVETSENAQFTLREQGIQLQGIQLQGIQLQGMRMLGFQFANATLNGIALQNLRVDKGELVAEQGQVTLRGTGLLNARLYAQVRNTSVNPATTATVEYEITGIEAESATHDPTQTGSTFLYALAQNVGGTWQAACPTDAEGRSAAIPLTATWDEGGHRVASSSLFTLACTTGAIAKCYRWGYRPWVTGYGDLVATHWACTRAVRADYCGNGTSHTRDGTVINLWDNIPAPGPLQTRATGTGMLFEAGWSTSGAVCLSRDRWTLGGPLIAGGCPNRLVVPILGLLGGTVCDLLVLLGLNPQDARVFNESNLNLNLDLLGL